MAVKSFGPDSSHTLQASCDSFLRSWSYVSQKQFSMRFVRCCDSQNRGISYTRDASTEQFEWTPS